MSELLLALRDLGLSVTFVPNDGQRQGDYSTALQRAGIEVLYGPLDERKLLRELAPALDVAILSRPEPTWRWQPLVREFCPEAKVIYDTVDLHFLREARRAEIEADPAVARAAARYHDMELALARMADATLVVSAAERDVLLDEQPELQVHVVPNIHGEEHTGRSFEERKGVLFVGSFPHLPNRDAAHWLVEEIMPLVRLEDPDIPTYIVGSSPTDDILALESDSVRILGWVPDLGNLYEHARLSVAPLRYGAGVKGKVGESMAHGLPVVTSRLGAEGMGLEHEYDALVADGAPAFAAEILRAYHDAELWTRLASNGRRTIARASSPFAIRSSLAKILEEIGVKVRVPDASRSSLAHSGAQDGD
jgi:glycosyltransferase involved in cell wall biosynthesis